VIVVVAMKIWIVFDCEMYEQSLIVGVYDSRDAADARAEEIRSAITSRDRNRCDVYEFTVGEPLPGRNK